MRAQLLLRWLRSAAQVRFSLSSGRTSDKLFLSNLWEYHILPETIPWHFQCHSKASMQLPMCE